MPWSMPRCTSSGTESRARFSTTTTTRSSRPSQVRPQQRPSRARASRRRGTPRRWADRHLLATPPRHSSLCSRRRRRRHRPRRPAAHSRSSHGPVAARRHLPSRCGSRHPPRHSCVQRLLEFVVGGQQLAVLRHASPAARACVPMCVIVPSSSSATLSASSTVEARWATTMPVTERSTRRSASSTRASVCMSSADSVSSSTRIRGRGQHRPGQRQPLPLAAGQAHALLADPGVQPQRQVVDELRRRRPRWPRRLLGRWRPAGRGGGSPATDIENSVGSSNAVATACRSAGRLQVADVDAVDADRAVGDVVEPGQQRGEHRLARTGRADQRDASPPARLRSTWRSAQRRRRQSGNRKPTSIELEPPTARRPRRRRRR